MKNLRLLGVIAFLAAALAIGVGADAQTSIPGSWGQLAPGGRLVLASPTAAGATAPPAVQTVSIVQSNNVFYVPYVNNLIPIYTNGAFIETPFSSSGLLLQLSTTNNVTTSEYDVFAISSGGAVTLCTGPAWTNGTTRAQAISLNTIWGIYVNTAVMSGTCFAGSGAGTAYTVPAGTGVYLGTLYTDAAAGVSWEINPAAASHGSNNILGVFNAYNRVHVVATESTTTTSNTYATNTWIEFDQTNLTDRISFIDGLGVSHVRASLQTNVTPTNSDVCQIGINENSITATPAPIGPVTAPATAFNMPTSTSGMFPPTLGFNYIQAMENAASGATCTWNTTAAYYALIADLDA